jgi:hypothetical protein
MTYSGYTYRILTAQSARTPGGAKKWLNAAGLLADGHALLAVPVEPGKSGSVALLSGPNGAIYQRPVTAADAAALPAWAGAFDPGPEWTLIGAPLEVVAPARNDYFKPQPKPGQEMEF